MCLVAPSRLAYAHLVVGDILIQGLVKVELVALSILGEVDLELHLIHQDAAVVHVNLHNVVITTLDLLQSNSVQKLLHAQVIGHRSNNRCI